MGRKKVVIKAKDRKVAELVADGKSYKQALEAAGYAAATCQKGRGGLTCGAKAALAKEMAKRGIKLEEVGAEYADENRIENLLAGRLVKNIVDGSDAGVQSVKTMGLMRRAGNAMRPDVSSGVIQIVLPPDHSRSHPFINAIEVAEPALLGGNQNWELIGGQYRWKGEVYQEGNPNAAPGLPVPSSEAILHENGADK